jgi:NitT/TauT family transport system substrate-binding protein
LALAACVHDAPAPDQAQLRIAGRPDVMEMGPIYYAASELAPGYATVIPGGVPNLFRTDDGAPHTGTSFDPWTERADLAGQAETQALRFSVDNPDLRIVMTVAEGMYRIVARRSSAVAALADLRGKRIGVFANTSAAYFLHRMLESAGLSEQDVTLVNLRPREMPAAIVERRVDAIAIWEPESERAFAALGADAIAFQDAAAYRELYNLNATARTLADPAKRVQIVRFVRALIEASRRSAEDPETVWALVAARSGYPVEIIAAGWRHHRFPAALAPDLLDVLEDEEQWLAERANRTPRSRAELSRLIDSSVLAEALAK